jgi:hypothetical protein
MNVASIEADVMGPDRGEGRFALREQVQRTQPSGHRGGFRFQTCLTF